MTFYQELKANFKDAWKLDPKRVIRLGLELGICTAFFIIAVILMLVL